MTITEFLTTRLDEDEAYARTAFADHNKAETEWSEPWSGGVLVGAHEDVVDTFDSGVSRHMVRHDPARVLREIAAKRAVLDLRGELGVRRAALSEYMMRTTHTEAGIEAYDHVIQHMAAVYADHPQYQSEWAPQA